jgi:hypothetical protein
VAQTCFHRRRQGHRHRARILGDSATEYWRPAIAMATNIAQAREQIQLRVPKNCLQRDAAQLLEVLMQPVPVVHMDIPGFGGIVLYVGAQVTAQLVFAQRLLRLPSAARKIHPK